MGKYNHVWLFVLFDYIIYEFFEFLRMNDSFIFDISLYEKVFLQLHIAVLLAGFTAILGKLIMLNESLLVWWRLLIALSVLALWMWHKKEPVKISVKDFFKIAGVGAVVVFHWVAFYGSIKYANVSVALVCFSATGFFTALLEPLILRKK